MTTTIQLGTLQLLDYATSGWVFEELIGWSGQTDDKSPNEERPNNHGSYPVKNSQRSSRAISVKAHYLGTSAADVEQAVDTLSAVGAEGPVRMAVATDRGSSWRMVTVSNVDPDDSFDEPQVTVSIDLIARDPRRYADGVWQSTGATDAGAGRTWPAVWPVVWPGGGSPGRITLTNSGRAPSSALLRVRGGFDYALITNVDTGARLAIDRPVPSGSYAEIDTRTKLATLNGGADISSWIRFREWETVPQLSSRTFQLDVVNPSGSPTLEGRVDSAWW